MKKIAIAAVVATLAFSGQAFAQAQNFAGFQVGADVESVGSMSKGEGSPDSTAKGTINFSVTAQYNFALGEKWVLGAGLGYQAAENNGGEWTNVKAKMKNVSSVFGLVGYANSQGMVYGKVASLSGVYSETSASASLSKTVSGTGIGGGYQGVINKNMFWTTELMFNSYDKVDTTIIAAGTKSLPSSSVISLGIAYKF